MMVETLQMNNSFMNVSTIALATPFGGLYAQPEDHR